MNDKDYVRLAKKFGTTYVKKKRLPGCYPTIEELEAQAKELNAKYQKLEELIRSSNEKYKTY